MNTWQIAIGNLQEAKPWQVHQADLPEERLCRRCGTTKPASEFWTTKNPNGTVRLKHECKTCQKARVLKWKHGKSAIVNGMRTCIQCGVEKREQFFTQNNGGRNRRCKECMRLNREAKQL